MTQKRVLHLSRTFAFFTKNISYIFYKNRIVTALPEQNNRKFIRLTNRKKEPSKKNRFQRDIHLNFVRMTNSHANKNTATARHHLQLP